MHINPKHLPPGWGFHPNDEQLLAYFSMLPFLLTQPNYDFYIKAVQLSEYDPWDLFAKFKINPGDKEMYFFTPCEYHKHNGLRKRKAGSGYWKCTGDPRLIMLGDSDNVIGTKRTLIFHNPDATEFVITEYVCTLQLNLPIKGDYVLCKLKIKSNKNKITRRKYKKARSDCKKKTSPNKKARKAKLSDVNPAWASTLGHQTLKEMIANSADGEGEQSNHMASDLENQYPDNMTAVTIYDKREPAFSMATRSLCEMTAVPIHGEGESACSIATQVESAPQIAAQNPSDISDTPTHDKGESFFQNVPHNLSQMISIYDRGESTFSMAIRSLCEITAVPIHGEGESTYSIATQVESAPQISAQNLSNISDMPTHEKGESFSQNVPDNLSQMIAKPTYDKGESFSHNATDNLSEMIAILTYDKVESFFQNVTDKLPEMAENRHQKTEVSFLEDYRSSSLACNVGETTLQEVESQYKKDISVPEDNNSLFMAFDVNDATFPEIDPQLLDEIIAYFELEENLNSTQSASSLLAPTCVENQNPYEKATISTNSNAVDFYCEKQYPGEMSAKSSHDEDKTNSPVTRYFGSQNPSKKTLDRSAISKW